MNIKQFLFPPTPYSVPRKLIALPSVVAFYTVGYMYLNYTTIHSEKFYDVSMAIEKNIPFFPELVWSYIFVYFLVIVLFLTLNSDELLDEAVKAFMLCSVIHFAFFYFMPVLMKDRPVLIPNGNLWHDYAAFWYWVDEPTTLFPSAHCSMSFLSALYVRRIHKWLGNFCILVAIYIGVCVVLIKQHYVADVFAGFLLASACYMFFARKRLLAGWGQKASAPQTV